jgi:hypothetical protein
MECETVPAHAVLEAVKIANGKNLENFGAENKEGPQSAGDLNTGSIHGIRPTATMGNTIANYYPRQINQRTTTQEAALQPPMPRPTAAMNPTLTRRSDQRVCEVRALRLP